MRLARGLFPVLAHVGLVGVHCSARAHISLTCGHVEVSVGHTAPVECSHGRRSGIALACDVLAHGCATGAVFLVGVWWDL